MSLLELEATYESRMSNSLLQRVLPDGHAHLATKISVDYALRTREQRKERAYTLSRHRLQLCTCTDIRTLTIWQRKNSRSNFF